MTARLTEVRDQMGGTGTIKLSELRDNGFTRVFSTAGLYRVNPFEVHAGDAQHPTSSADHSLAAWDGYVNWTALQARGTNFDLTNVTTTQASFSWTNAPGAVLDTASLAVSFWINTCTSAANCISTDPFAGTETELNGGAKSHTEIGLTAGNWYVAGVKIKWDEDGDGTHEQVSTQYLDNCCTDGAGTAAGDNIYWQQDTTTTTTTTSGTCECIASQCTAPCDLFGEFCTDVSECSMV